MRELVIKKSCDECGAETTRSYVVGIVAADTPPELRTVDVCDEHAKPFEAVSAILVHAAPFKLTRPKKSRDDSECEICGKVATTRKGMMDHIWSVHIRQPRPVQSLTCPECGRVFERPLSVGVHRSAAHGYDVLAEAYAIAASKGVKAQ